MKNIMLLFALVLSSFLSRAQDMAFAGHVPAAPAFFLDSSRARTHSPHHTSKIANAGTWTLIGGVAIGFCGLVEYKSATSVGGPYTFVNQGKQNEGTLLEIVGVAGAVAGLAMIIAGSSNNHTHRQSKVGIYAPRVNEIGVACRL